MRFSGRRRRPDEEETLGLNLPTIGVHCETTLAPSRVDLKGTWYKSDTSFPLEFKKGAAPAADKRPGP